MTTGIKNWSTTAGSNNATPPNGAPEGMAPSAVNNIIRQMMAEIRSWFEDPDWIDFGHTGLAYVAATQFRVTGDKTAVYPVGRRVRAIGTTPFTIYGTISVSAYSAPNTTVTVVWDSGTLNATLSEVAVGSSLTGDPISSNSVKFESASIPYASITDPPAAVSGVPTGLVAPFVASTAPTGWVMLSSRTIGNAASGGTERANADTEALFTLLWNQYSNTQLVIQNSSGVDTTRGANAAADFAANKRLPVLDLRGRSVSGWDSMGGTSANRMTGSISAIDGDTIGATGGEEAHTLTAGESAALSYTVTTNAEDGDGNGFVRSSLGGSTVYSASGKVSSNAGGGAHNNMQPTIVLPYIVKL